VNRPGQPVRMLALCLFALLMLPLSAPSASQPQATVLVRMPASTYNVLRAASPVPLGDANTRVLDYGSFVWLELPDTELDALRATGLPIEVREEPYTLRLGEQSFDPVHDAVQPPPGWDSVRTDGPDLHLVQFAGPPRDEWLAGLRAQGLEPIQYIPPFTYVVWGQPAAVERATSAREVRWTGPFVPAYRVQPQWRALDSNPVPVDVLLARAADVDGAIREIEALGGTLVGRAVLNDTFELASFSLPGTAFQDAARVPGVYSIQPEPGDGGLRGELSNQVSVNNVDGTNLAYPGYLAWLSGIGLSGSGVTIANVDAGVQNDHPDLVNRLIPCTGQSCGGSATDGHGTHTAGIMAADGSSGVVDAAGFLRGLGMAPGASLVEQLYSPFYLDAGGMLLLMGESYNNGATLSGNSWGPSSTPQGYDNDTMQVDIGVRDADSGTPGNQPLAYVLSIMNGYGGVQTQGTPDEAKNILTIGSTKMQFSNGSQNLNIDDLSANTAHGPALDGRTIPHMVAPGCYVDSTVPLSIYSTMCGTSMASPHVSGAVALFVEYYRALSGDVDPSPALIKAAFLPVAHDLAGHLDADGYLLGHPFDGKQGWGRMDAAAVLDPQVPVVYLDQSVVFDSTGQEWAQSLAVADSSQPVRIMLVWTDAPGHGLGGTTPAWNNDLDLVVEAGGSTYHGNAFGPDGWSQAGSVADPRNNTEGVFLPPGASGSLALGVVASNINSDGVPGVGDATDQDFALACYNCLAVPDYSLSVRPSALQMCAPDTVTATIDVGQILGYAYDVSLEAAGLPQTVTMSISPTLVSPPGEALLSLRAGAAVPEGNYALVITGTAETDNVHTVAVDVAIHTAPPATPALLSPADGATNQPYESPAFAWEHLPQAGSYSLQLAQAPTFETLLIDATGLPTNTYTHSSPLEPATCYFWRARGENGCGSSEWAEPFRFASLSSQVLFSDDMEAGDAQWTHHAARGLDEWQMATARSYSPSHAWYAPDAAAVTDTYLRNAVAVPIESRSTLTFWHLHFFEGNYDGSVLELSTDGGATWQDLGPHITANGYNGTIDSSYSNPLAGRPAWVGDLASWTQVKVDLDSFAGHSVLIRWRLGCDIGIGDEGWYIDDVQITAPLPASDPPALSAVQPSAGSPVLRMAITITGQSFRPAVTAMLDGTMLSDVTYIDATTLSATVPEGLAPGVYDLTVINGDCQSATLNSAYTVDPSIEVLIYYLPVILK
jgi:serine protease AprX